jgi:hypothetical protein
LHLNTLAVQGRLKVNRQAANVAAVLRGRQGWLVIESGPEAWTSVTRYDSRGRETGGRDASVGHVFDPKRGIAFVAGESSVSALPLGRGKVRTWKASWRREIAEGILPQDPVSGIVVSPEISAITLSRDGKTLIVTERLAGDPKG